MYCPHTKVFAVDDILHSLYTCSPIRTEGCDIKRSVNPDVCNMLTRYPRCLHTHVDKEECKFTIQAQLYLQSGAK